MAKIIEIMRRFFAATAFAEAGEFDTARSLLRAAQEPPPTRLQKCPGENCELGEMTSAS